MKKILALVAVAVASVALAAADPILFVHGFAGWNAGASHLYDTTNEQAIGPYTYTKSRPFANNLDFGGGVAINIPFGGYFGVQPGLDFYFNQFGTKYTHTVLNTTTSNTYAYSYMSLDIPLLLTIKYKKFNFALGPNFSIPVGDLKVSKNDGDATSVSGSINHFIFGLQFGAGYEERLGMARLIGSVRYLLDLTPALSVTTTDSNGEHNYKYFTRRGLFLDIGAKIPLSF